MNFTSIISDWYHINKRELPWRKTRQPYPIWVSEVILQQTRVNQGMDYYHRFLETFPTVVDLANASEEQVLSVWKGLGYYSRARNMHTTAKMVVNKFNSNFPLEYKNLILLKGIGPYTAAAISSICGNEPHPVVDGNVIRVFSRIFGIHEVAGSAQSHKKVYEKSLSFIDKDEPGNYNQAVMEFGALFCKPRQPLCDECVFKNDCYAFINGRVNELPVPKTPIVKRERFFNYLVFHRDDGAVLMHKRKGNDIWKKLWEFPLIETDHALSPTPPPHPLIENLQIETERKVVPEYTDTRHILTHQIIHARFFSMDFTPGPISDQDNYQWQHNPLISGLPVARMIEKYLEKRKE